MALPKRVRFEVLRRDNFACRYCGAKAPFVELQIDHVIPRHHGGTDDRWNLTAACFDCNIGKTNGVPSDELIHEVREDESTYLVSKGYEVFPCMYCHKPVHFGPEDSYMPGVIQCEPCNNAVVDAYEYGFARGAGLDVKKWQESGR